VLLVSVSMVGSSTNDMLRSLLGFGFATTSQKGRKTQEPSARRCDAHHDGHGATRRVVTGDLTGWPEGTLFFR
jgi:hypothetical protein